MSILNVLCVAAALCLAGCALVDARKQNAETEQRIGAKQGQLDAETAKQARLNARTTQLLSDLDHRQMNAAQLRAQLDDLQAMNDSLAAQTDALRRQRDESTRKLRELSSQAQALERNTALPQDERERQLAALKKKTQDILTLLLKG